MKGTLRAQKRRGLGLWILAVVPILAIPFEAQYVLLGVSLAKLAIIPLLVGVVLFQPGVWFSIWNHKVLLSAMGFLAWGTVAELFHPFSDTEFLYRIFQMLVFATLVAAVSSEPVALRRLLLALVVASSLLGVYLIFNFYGLVNADISTVKEAGRLRAQAFDKMSLDQNLNIVAYTVGMGTIIALARLMVESKNRRRIFWGGIYLLCAVGAFIPISRGAFLAVIMTSALMLWRLPMREFGFRKVLIAIAALLMIVLLTPAALTERLFATSVTKTTGEGSGRTKILMAALESFPEYWALGVGNGQFSKRWGRMHGFRGFGPHNGFLTAWIYYGLPGLILFGLVCYSAARQCPVIDNRSWEAIAIFGLLVASLIWLLFTHNLYLKTFGVVLGLLMGASRIPSTARLTYPRSKDFTPRKRRELVTAPLGNRT